MRGRCAAVNVMVEHEDTSTESRHATKDSDCSWRSVDRVVQQIPANRHLVIFTDANARPETREDAGEGADNDVLEAHGRILLSDNGEQLL